MRAALELIAYQADRERRLRLEAIPAGLRHLSPLYRPEDDEDDVDDEVRRRRS